MKDDGGRGRVWHFAAWAFAKAMGQVMPVMSDKPDLSRVEAAPADARPEAGADTACTPETSPRTSARVLVVDDSPVNRRVAELLLSNEGYAVSLVSGGVEALSAASREHFDVILMDLLMPEMDGLEVTRRIRQSERCSERHVTIIALTAQVFEGERERCLAAGMDDYLAKPIRIGDLRRVFAIHLTPRGRHGTDRPDLSGKQETLASGSAQGVDEPQLDGLAVVDWHVARQRLPGVPGLLVQLSAQLRDECSAKCAEIQAGLVTADAARVMRAAHTIKSSSDLFGAARVHQTALYLERLARQGDLSRVTCWAARLNEEVSRLVSELEKTPASDWS